MIIILFYIAISLGHMTSLSLAVDLVWSGNFALDFTLESLPYLIQWVVLVLLNPALIIPVSKMARRSGHRRAKVLLWVNILPMALGLVCGVLLAGME